MRRLVLVIFVMSAIISLVSLQHTNLCDINIEGRYVCYTSSNHYFESVDMSEAKSEFSKSNCVGECIILDNLDNVDLVLKKLRAKYILSEEFQDNLIEYYFSPRLRDYIIVGGNRVNLQISYGSKIKIGYPIIREGF